MENLELAFMRLGNGFKSFDAVELALEGTVALEGVPMNDLHGAASAHDVSRQPDLAVAAAADAFDQFIVGDLWWRNVGGRLRARSR